MRVISPDNTGPVCPHIMYTSEIMAAIMRRDKFMQIFCFQISQMLDRSQYQIMKIFYQENMAKSLLASYHTMMMPWYDGLRRLFTVCPTVGTRNRPFWRKFKFDIKSLDQSPRDKFRRRRNKQTITKSKSGPGPVLRPPRYLCLVTRTTEADTMRH